MGKKYFPGANSGEGFYSRFDGIVPQGAAHYTYVLKGGPGVGKNTLMKKVAKAAEEKGYATEQFRCASDPKSLDALRVPQLGIVLLDGTSPHSIDPAFPGISDEIINLGVFKNQKEFLKCSDEIKELFMQNKRHYRAAYSMLKAACVLKREAINAARESVNTDKLKAFVSRLVTSKKQGEKRGLFIRSATPDGVIDFSSSLFLADAVCFCGIVGEIALLEAYELINGKCAEVFYDFVDPHFPRCIIINDNAICVSDDGDALLGFVSGDIPLHVNFCLDKSELLVKRATSELSKALAVHDKIEEIYRDYVDYKAVSQIGDDLMKKIGV